jgi:hypothetical protein
MFIDSGFDHGLELFFLGLSQEWNDSRVFDGRFGWVDSGCRA